MPLGIDTVDFSDSRLPAFLVGIWKSLLQRKNV